MSHKNESPEHHGLEELVEFASPASLLGYELARERNMQTSDGTANVTSGGLSIPRMFILGLVPLAALILLSSLLIRKPIIRLENILREFASQVQPSDLGPAQPSVSITLNSPSPKSPIAADGEQKAELQFQVILLGQSRPVSDGTVVRFEAAGGTVDPALAGTQGGLARTWFTPDPWQEGRDQALLVVRVGEMEQAFSLTLAAPPIPGSLQLEAPSRLKAGGQDEVTILVWDTEGRPMAGVPLLLQPEPGEAGWFEPPAVISGEDGRAVALYTASGEPGPTRLVAEVEGQPEIRDTADLEVVADLNRLELIPSRTDLFNTGTDEVVLSVQVFDVLDAPLPAELRLEVLAGEAWFLDESGQPITTTNVMEARTDEAGSAAVPCRVGTAPGEVLIAVDAAGQRREVRLTVAEIKATTLTIEADRTELVADGQQVAALLVTVLDQRGEPLPGVEVQLRAEPDKMGSLAGSIVTGESGMESVSFVAAKDKTGPVIVTATAGEASASITLTLSKSAATPTAPPAPTIPPRDSDGDGRDDDRERALGTDPAVADDRVKTIGNLTANGDSGRVILEGVPVGTVLLRSGEQAEAGYQAAKLRCWVRQDNLSADRARLVVTAKTPVVLEGGDPNNPSGNRPSLTDKTNDYQVSLVEGQAQGDFFLVEIWGWFQTDYLDRP